MSRTSKLAVLNNGSVQETYELVKSARSEKKLVLLVGECTVKYNGRAKSTLTCGERILILKEDGSALVHRTRGYEPVNWQPSGCVFHAQKKKDTLVIEVIRKNPREVLSIHFKRIVLASSMKLFDLGEFYLHASEKDMQKAILLNPSLVEDGLIPIINEKKISPGFVDVYCVDQKGKNVLIEIKRKTAGKEAVMQLAKYVKYLKSKGNHEVRGILVAPRISKGVQRISTTLGLEIKLLDPKKCAEMLMRNRIRKLTEFC